ncbi:MAG TPA: CbiX/SirB N-terminal domain-containing protein [Gemmatimonadaceae bacterium]|nr:CbiX/SirB N-terminal domain-containing protein [Gemmatimonadaceae bacterium]
MKAILLIDHGSTRDEANEMLACVANLVQSMAGTGTIVRYAHMELAPPTIEEGFAACVAAGATEVVVFPYMLSPGKHSMRDIPRMVGDAAAAHPSVAFTVTPAFGVHEKLAEVVLLRAEVEPDRSGRALERAHCWHPGEQEGSCGNACRAGRQTADRLDRAATT